MAADIFSIGAVSLYIFNIELSFGGDGSEDDINHSLAGDIERAIAFAQSQEKVMAWKQHS